MKRILLFMLMLATVLAVAADKDWEKGTLVDVSVGQRTTGVPSGNGTLIAQHNVFQVSVKLVDIVYTGETRSKEVSKLVIGDPVEVTVDDKNLYLHCPDGKEIKAKILKKARSSS